MTARHGTLAMPRKQTGTTLVIGLIFLLVLTILGVTSLGTTSLEERMAGNLQSSTQAFQAAEAGVAQDIRDDEFADQDQCDFGALTETNIASGTHFKHCHDFLQQTSITRAADRSEIFGQGTASQNHFHIFGIGRTEANANARVNQGIKYLSPSPSNVLIE